MALTALRRSRVKATFSPLALRSIVIPWDPFKAVENAAKQAPDL